MHSFILADAAVPNTLSALFPLGEAEFQFVVFAALALTWAALVLLAVSLKRLMVAKAAFVPPVVATPASTPTPVAVPVASVAPVVPVVAAPAAHPEPVISDEIPPELVSVIAAAVQLTLRDAYRIQAIVPVSGHDWAHEGRRQIFASHQIR